MKNIFTVESEYVIRGYRSIVLDKKRGMAERGTKNVVIDGKAYPYLIQYHDQMIGIVDPPNTESFLGKTLTFE